MASSRPRIKQDSPLPQRASVHRAHELCFVANSVSCPVEVEL